MTGKVSSTFFKHPIFNNKKKSKGMVTKTIRTAICAAFAIAEIAALRAVAGEAAMPNQDVGLKDAPQGGISMPLVDVK